MGFHVSNIIKISNLISFFLVFLCITMQSTGQQLPIVADDSRTFNLPPLQALIDSALERSPLLKRYDAIQAKVSMEKYFQRRQWMQSLYLEANTRYGAFDQLYFTGATDPGESPIGYTYQQQQTNYYVGVSLKLPLATFVNQRKRIQQLNYNLDEIRMEQGSVADNVIKTVIENYYEVMFRHESMNTFFAIYQDVKISYLDAGNRLQEQKISFNDYAIISSTYGKAKNDYDKARTDFLISLNMLRFISGWQF
jgi:outer membrane protein TolC